MNPSGDSFWAPSGGGIPLWPLLIASGIGYLLGSIPFGYLVARARGVNIFEVGSKSSGATNIRRVLGARAGYLVFALDALKGAAAAGWPHYFPWAVRDPLGSPAATVVAIKILGLVGLIFALLGHAFSCFIGFRGGKGVATGAGGFLVLMPPVTSIAAAIWALTFYSTGYVSLASILAAVTMPSAAFFAGEPALITVVAAVIGIFVIFRHRANIGRLLKGTEHKSERK